jgi:NADPH-dependent ferric siderophore reductase
VRAKPYVYTYLNVAGASVSPTTLTNEVSPMTSPQPKPMVERKKRPAPRIADVRRVERITPHMVRVTLSGEHLEGFSTKGVAEHVRVFLPDAETSELLLPVPGPDGLAFPEDHARPTSRAYTPRRWDPETNELDIDFVIHGEGPASNWASRVKPGDKAVVSGQPGGSYLPEAGVDWYVIAGDEAALPAIGTLLEVLPPSMHADVYVEVLDEAEDQQLTSEAKLNVTWLHRGSEEQIVGRQLVAAMKAAALPEGDGRIWVSAEASIMREVRRHLLEDRGLDRAMLRTQGYWKQGTLNHTDHDMGDDE